jgi:hypothetical protein
MYIYFPFLVNFKKGAQMKTPQKENSNRGLVRVASTVSAGFTHEELKDYLAKGRRLRSAQAGALFSKLWRLCAAVLIGCAGWIGSTLKIRPIALAERFQRGTGHT